MGWGGWIRVFPSLQIEPLDPQWSINTYTEVICSSYISVKDIARLIAEFARPRPIQSLQVTNDVRPPLQVEYHAGDSYQRVIDEYLIQTKVVCKPFCVFYARIEQNNKYRLASEAIDQNGTGLLHFQLYESL